MVRDRDSGRGFLWPDAYAEDRLNFVPPAASALLVIFSRNHNVSRSCRRLLCKISMSQPGTQYVADMLLKINERGRWTDPPPSDETKRALQDEEIFQVARLVKYVSSRLFPVLWVPADWANSCGHFMAMIFGDYVAGFLGLGRDGSSWSMNPFDVSTHLRAAVTV